MGCNTSQEKTAPQVSDDTNEEQQQQQEQLTANDTNTTIKSDRVGESVKQEQDTDTTVQDNSHNVAAEIKTKTLPAVECNGNGKHLAAPEALEEDEEESQTETPLLNGENGEPMGKDEGEF